MLEKYPELDGMDKEELMQESKKREMAYIKWSKLKDKTSVPYEEYIKNETGEAELDEEILKLLDDNEKTGTKPTINLKNIEDEKQLTAKTQKDEKAGPRNGPDCIQGRENVTTEWKGPRRPCHG